MGHFYDRAFNVNHKLLFSGTPMVGEQAQEKHFIGGFIINRIFSNTVPFGSWELSYKLTTVQKGRLNPN